MSLLLKSTYIYLFTATVIFGVYGWWVFGYLGVEYFNGPESLVRIGKAIVTLIVCGYAFEIAVIFLVGIFGYKVQKQPLHEFALDERDMQILYKSIYASHLVLCTGLFLAIGALAIGWNAFWVFNLMVLAFLFSVIAELVTKLFLYQQGA